MPSPEAEVLKGTADLLALPEGAEALRYVETTYLMSTADSSAVWSHSDLRRLC